MTECTFGNAKADGREPKSCLSRVFNFKLGCFVMCTIPWPIQAWPSLEWKTRPKFSPVSLSLSMPEAKKIEIFKKRSSMATNVNLIY